MLFISPHQGSGYIFQSLVCLALIGLTTLALLVIDDLLSVKHLVMGYLMPAMIIAIFYGSSFAAITSLAGGILATYFLLPPKFSFRLVDTLAIAELGFFLLLALIASKAAAVVARDRQVRRLQPRHIYARHGGRVRRQAPKDTRWVGRVRTNFSR